VGTVIGKSWGAIAVETADFLNLHWIKVAGKIEEQSISPLCRRFFVLSFTAPAPAVPTMDDGWLMFPLV
jgi:hypothetical protein